MKPSQSSGQFSTLSGSADNNKCESSSGSTNGMVKSSSGEIGSVAGRRVLDGTVDASSSGGQVHVPSSVLIFENRPRLVSPFIFDTEFIRMF